MPTCCVVGCPLTLGPGESDLSYHKFPLRQREPERYAAWLKQTQITRQGWTGPRSKRTFLCSRHFTPDCFEERPLLMTQLGFKPHNKHVLKKGSVPSLFVPSERPFRRSFNKIKLENRLDNPLDFSHVMLAGYSKQKAFRKASNQVKDVDTIFSLDVKHDTISRMESQDNFQEKNSQKLGQTVVTPVPTSGASQKEPVPVQKDRLATDCMRKILLVLPNDVRIPMIGLKLHTDKVPSLNLTATKLPNITTKPNIEPARGERVKCDGKLPVPDLPVTAAADLNHEASRKEVNFQGKFICDSNDLNVKSTEHYQIFNPICC